MRLTVALLAAGLIGCSGGVALKPMWVPCRGIDIYGMEWSPDGRQIAYIAGDRLNTLDLGNGASLQLELPDDSYGPIWSPNSERFLIARERGYPEVELFILELTGTIHTVTKTWGFPDTYLWSPDGEQIAITYNGSGEPATDLVVMHRTGAAIWKISEAYPESHYLSNVSWSPNGNYLAFSGFMGGESLLMVISASGDDLQQLYSSSAVLESVQWSPDGNWIAFQESFGGGVDATKIIQADGSELTVLANENTQYLRWLPNSHGIVFLAENDEIVTLSVEDLSRSVLTTELPSNTSRGHFPEIEFSPDGTMIGYLLTDGRNAFANDLYVMNVDGTSVQQLTDNPGNHKCFQWPF